MGSPGSAWLRWLFAVTALTGCGAILGCNADIKPGGMDPPAQTVSDPGRITIHRLNRVEYNNTVHDLFGTAQHPADEFPSDDRGYGFDNIADVLSLSPLLVDLYQQAAEKLINEAIDLPLSKPSLVHVKAIDAKATVGATYNGFWNLYSNGDLTGSAKLPLAGKYKISTRCFGQQAGPDPVSISMNFDGLPAQTFSVPEVENAPGTYSTTVMSTAGVHFFGVSFLNDYYNPMLNQDRNLIVDWIQIEGPLDLPPAVNPLRDRIMICNPVTDGVPACGAKIIRAFGKRAWRRPLADDEVMRLSAFIDQANKEGDSFDQGIKLALEAMLLSPHFIFRVELDADPTSLTAHPLNAYELAARLSYFLWSSMPDEALLAAADSGDLLDPALLTAQVTRMLADPRAEALVQNFAGQWLYTRGLDDHVTDYATFPQYDAALKLSMNAETQAYFREFLFKDSTMDQLLTANFSFINDRLARHYGLAGSFSKDLIKTPLPDERRGLLTQASVLAVTSFPERTSPVKRGKWVLDQLMCSGPPPPPPNIPALPAQKMSSGTLRHIMEVHRANPVCSSCHTLMDPIGFGMENFDGIGQYRTQDQGLAIDSSGLLPDGQKFVGAVELSKILAKDPRFYQCTTQQLYIYGLGRGVDTYDTARLDAMTKSFVGGGYKLRDLILSVVKSDAFRKRRGEPIAMTSGGGQP